MRKIILQIRTLQQNELKLLFFYSNQEGWGNEELHTTALFLAHPNDFFIAYKEGKLLGFILAIKHSQEFGFISSFIVLKEFRGLGYGQKLFTHALQHLKGCQIALDSVVNKQKLYKKFGFVPYFDVIVYRFIIGSVTLPSSEIQTIDFDKKLSLKNQNPYMINMLLNENIEYKAVKKEDEISSFALSFQYKDGYKIHIESLDINEAITLFFALSDKYKKGTAFYLQASKQSSMLLAMAKLLNMREYNKFVRMYNKIVDK